MVHQNVAVIVPLTNLRLVCETQSMDPTWLLVVLILIVLFASISVVGTLRRIRDATEKSLVILQSQASRENADN